MTNEMEHGGHTEMFFTTQDGDHLTMQTRYSGKLVVTAHAVGGDVDPGFADNIAFKLDRFMRDHRLSRLEAYWNAVPPEDE
jgi:hypothetical protein